MLVLAGGVSACGGEVARPDADRIVVVAAAAAPAATRIWRHAERLSAPLARAGVDRGAALQRAVDATATSTYPDLPLDLLETATDVVPGDGRA